MAIKIVRITNSTSNASDLTRSTISSSDMAAKNTIYVLNGDFSISDYIILHTGSSIILESGTISGGNIYLLTEEQENSANIPDLITQTNVNNLYKLFTVGAPLNTIAQNPYLSSGSIIKNNVKKYLFLLFVVLIMSACSKSATSEPEDPTIPDTEILATKTYIATDYFNTVGQYGVKPEIPTDYPTYKFTFLKRADGNTLCQITLENVKIEGYPYSTFVLPTYRLQFDSNGYPYIEAPFENGAPLIAANNPKKVQFKKLSFKAYKGFNLDWDTSTQDPLIFHISFQVGDYYYQAYPLNITLNSVTRTICETSGCLDFGATYTFSLNPEAKTANISVNRLQLESLSRPVNFELHDIPFTTGTDRLHMYGKSATPIINGKLDEVSKITDYSCEIRPKDPFFFYTIIPPKYTLHSDKAFKIESNMGLSD